MGLGLKIEVAFPESSFGLACAVPSVTSPSGPAYAFIRLQFYFTWADGIREFSMGDILRELTAFLMGSVI